MLFGRSNPREARVRRETSWVGGWYAAKASAWTVMQDDSID